MIHPPLLAVLPQRGDVGRDPLGRLIPEAVPRVDLVDVPAGGFVGGVEQTSPAELDQLVLHEVLKKLSAPSVGLVLVATVHAGSVRTPPSYVKIYPKFPIRVVRSEVDAPKEAAVITALGSGFSKVPAGGAES